MPLTEPSLIFILTVSNRRNIIQEIHCQARIGDITPPKRTEFATFHTLNWI